MDRLERSGDHWAVKISRKSQDAGVCEEMEHFDKVIVTSGAFSKAFLPTYPGVESYKGQILHVQGFKK